MADAPIWDNSPTIQPIAGAAAHPPPAPAIDPALLDAFRVIHQEGPLASDSVQALASEMRNRMTQLGQSLSDVVHAKNQYGPGSPLSSGEYKGWLRVSTIPPTDPAIQQIAQIATPILTGQTPPVGPWTQHWSPRAAAALGEKRPDWADPTKGQPIGGQLFYANDLGSSAPSGEPPTTQASEQPVWDLPAEKPAAPGGNQQADPPDQWPVYDPINQVGRNKDGSIAYVGQPSTAVPNPQGGLPIININSSGNPKAIAAWQKAHPLDISNLGSRMQYPATPPAATRDAMDAFNQGSFGIAQGVGDVGGSLADIQARLAKISPFLAGEPDVSSAAMNAQAGARVLQRNQADAAMGGNPYYGLGQLTGQVAATLPIMAMTGGLGDAAGAAAEGSRLGPLADFLGGRSTGLARIPSLMTSGAAQGAEANVLASGGSSQTLPQQAASGAIAGAALAPVIPAAGAALAKLRSLGPAITDNVQSVTNAALRMKMPVTGLQIRALNGDTNAGVQFSEGLSRPGTGFHSSYVQQKKAWTTNGVGALFGGDGAGQPVKDLSPTTLGAAQRRIGATLDDFASRNSVPDTGPMIDQLNGVQASIDQMPVDDGIKTGLRNQIGLIRTAAQNGSLSGEDYATIIRHGGDLSDAMQNDDPAVSRKAAQIRGIVDDAMAQNAAPQDQAAFKLAQAQYKNLMTVKRAARNTDVEGQITPNALNTAVVHEFPDAAIHGTANAAGDPAQVAAVGQSFLKQVPNSYTAPRLANIMKTTALAGLGGGAGVELLTQHPDVAMKLAAVGALGTGANYGLNVARGVLGGSGAGAAMVSPPDISAIMQALAGVNDNVVPAGVLGLKQAQSASQ